MKMLAVVLMLCWSTGAKAEAVFQLPAICFDGNDAKKFLDATGTMAGQGLMTDQLIVQLRTKLDGQYSIAIINTKGRACVVAIGESWTRDKTLLGDDL